MMIELLTYFSKEYNKQVFKLIWTVDGYNIPMIKTF